VAWVTKKLTLIHLGHQEIPRLVQVARYSKHLGGGVNVIELEFFGPSASGASIPQQLKKFSLS